MLNAVVTEDPLYKKAVRGMQRIDIHRNKTGAGLESVWKSTFAQRKKLNPSNKYKFGKYTQRYDDVPNALKAELRYKLTQAILEERAQEVSSESNNNNRKKIWRIEERSGNNAPRNPNNARINNSRNMVAEPSEIQQAMNIMRSSPKYANKDDATIMRKLKEFFGTFKLDPAEPDFQNGRNTWGRPPKPSVVLRTARRVRNRGLHL